MKTAPRIAISDHDHRAIAAAVCTTKEREALDLVDHHGMSLRASATHLGISVSALRARIDSARTKITRHIQQGFPLATTDATTDEQVEVPRIVIALLIQRDGPRCYLCQTIPEPTAYRIEHIIPRAHGGTDTPENIALSCAQCNAKKGSRIVTFHVSSRRPVYTLADG